MRIWMDGKLVEQQDAKVSVFDHGLLYGDGVFEGIRVYGGTIFQCQAHVDRLFDSARRIRLAIPLTKQEIVEAMHQALRANGLSEAYIRLVVTRGEGNLGLSPFLSPSPCIFIIPGQIQLYPPEMYEKGMAVIIAKTVRTAATMLDPSVKSLNYLNNIMAKIEAIDAGVPEAIMLNVQGHVAECTGDNIFTIKDGTAFTPPPPAGILIGITRGVVIKLAGRLGIPLAEKDLTPGDLYQADECFLTGTAAEVIAVTKIDDKVIGTGKPGPITNKLMAAFREFIRDSDQ